MECVSFGFLQLRRHIVLVGWVYLLSSLVFIATHRARALSPNTERADDAILLTDSIVRCPLREGETTFIISARNDSTLERLIVINENARARGELKIAVSADKLSASSEKWRPVEGSIRFDHKRLFNVSLLGIQARYVKLVFQIERAMSETRSSSETGMATLSTIGRL